MRRRKQTICWVMILSMFSFLSATGEAADRSKWPQKMNVAAGPVGSAGFTPMAAWCPMMNNLLGINLSPESTGGLSISTQMVHKNLANFAISSTAEATEGWEGSAKWTKGEKLRNYRAMVVLDLFANQFYALRSSNIKGFNDIKGKSINLSRAGSVTDVWGRRLFETFNIPPSKILNLNPSDANNQLGDRLLDIAMVQGGAPHPAINESSVTQEIVVFGIPKKESKSFIEKYPILSEMTIPANTYKGQKEAFSTIGSYMVLIAHKDMPDDLVFALVQATFDHKDQLASAYKPWSVMNSDNVKSLRFPLHRGAYPYYQKAGIPVPKEAMPLE